MNHGVSRRETLFGAKHVIFQEFELISNRTSHDLRGNGLAKPDFRLGSWLVLAVRAQWSGQGLGLGRCMAGCMLALMARFNVRCPKGTTPPSGLTWPPISFPMVNFLGIANMVEH